MSLSLALQNAISGLALNQRSLDVTAQNVANVNTQGYSRKIVNQQALVIGGQGAGVQISSIERKVNEFILKDMRAQSSHMNDYAERNQFYGRMQDLFGSPGSDTSVGFAIADLSSRIQALSVSPENTSLMTEITSRAKLIAQQFNEIASQVENLRVEADRNIATAVTTVNTQLSRIQDLNIRIAESEALNQGTSELRDQRDLAVSKIAELMNVNYFERSNGELVIFTDSGRPLLDRTALTLTHTAVSSFDPAITWAAGSVNTIDLNGTDITSEISSGAMAGWIDLRDQILPDLHSQFEELAQALAHQMNAIHNDGVGYPGLAVMTGTREVAASDTPPWSGEVRLAVLDADGVVQEFQDFDLSTYATVGDLIADIDALANATATIDANGNVVIDALGANRIAINEMDSAVTVGNQSFGLSEFLGLNDYFVQPNNYDVYTTSQQNASSVALAAGTLTFSGAFGTTTVAVAAGDDLATIAASVNANGVLAAAGIAAFVIADGSGYRLRIEDADSDNFFVTDSGTLVSAMDLNARKHGVAASLSVRNDILLDPSRISRGELSASATLAAGDTGTTAGSQAVIDRLANLFNTPLSFDAVGQLPDTVKSLANYATAILSLNSTQAQNVADIWATKTFLHDNLQEKARTVSAVNLDEEMANMIILENAYAASARVITTTSALFDELLNMTR
ncbi:MAG: flagellar hook-associated protein FlgK [Rhodospirillaceae bacterium]